MANVRLLRQQLIDYDKRVRAANASYAGEYAIYADQVNAWNEKSTSNPQVVNYIAGKGFRTVELSNGAKVNLDSQAAVPETGSYYVGGQFVPAETFLGPAPTAPAQLQGIRSPNLTQREVEEVKNPGTNAAGVVMANAKGYTGKSEIAALNDQPSRFMQGMNPFAKQEDPNNLKERGILARTLAGQLG